MCRPCERRGPIRWRCSGLTDPPWAGIVCGSSRIQYSARTGASAEEDQRMRSVRLIPLVVLSSSIALLTTPAASQGTAADYARAEGLRGRIDSLVLDAPDAPVWVGRESSQFVYRKSLKGGSTFVLFDAATLAKRAAFDHDRLATAIA